MRKAPSSLRSIPESWALGDFLRANEEMRLEPTGIEAAAISGRLSFRARGDAGEVEDGYDVTILLPLASPNDGYPTVFEAGGRIPKAFHHLTDGSLCLGSPTRLRLLVVRNPRIDFFVEKALIPYLYGRSCYERTGQMPLGELAHGRLGIGRDLIALFHMPRGTSAGELLEVASLRRRQANKRRCPCGSGRRLGKCHNLEVNRMRTELPRRWFAEQSGFFFGAAAA